MQALPLSISPYIIPSCCKGHIKQNKSLLLSLFFTFDISKGTVLSDDKIFAALSHVCSSQGSAHFKLPHFSRIVFCLNIARVRPNLIRFICFSRLYQALPACPRFLLRVTSEPANRQVLEAIIYIWTCAPCTDLTNLRIAPEAVYFTSDGKFSRRQHHFWMSRITVWPWVCILTTCYYW